MNKIIYTRVYLISIQRLTVQRQVETGIFPSTLSLIFCSPLLSVACPKLDIGILQKDKDVLPSLYKTF